MTSSSDVAWSIVQAAARRAEQLADTRQAAAFSLADDGDLRPMADGDPDAVVRWDPNDCAPSPENVRERGGRWQSLVPADDPRAPLLDLYLPICSATSARP